VAVDSESLRRPDRSEARATRFWSNYPGDPYDAQSVANNPKRFPAHAAALMQILATDDRAMRRGLVEHLGRIQHAEATAALARLAIFSFDSEVRKPAIAALKDRPKEDISATLLAGLRYPWPAVVHNAGEAIVQLGRKDLVPQLVGLLDEPDPRAPAEATVDGQKRLVVREVVRINHHRNCQLCHPPGNTPDVALSAFGASEHVVIAGVPSPYEPFRSLSTSYGFDLPDIVVRADVTYLRQDFSLLQPVKDAAPWPEQQRFDFLVRTRTAPAEAVVEYRTWLQEQGPDHLAPHQQAALVALRALTGRDAAPTAQAWRAVLAN
jgi:hypothetical protein